MCTDFNCLSVALVSSPPKNCVDIYIYYATYTLYYIDFYIFEFTFPSHSASPPKSFAVEFAPESAADILRTVSVSFPKVLRPPVHRTIQEGGG